MESGGDRHRQATKGRKRGGGSLFLELGLK